MLQRESNAYLSVLRINPLPNGVTLPDLLGTLRSNDGDGNEHVKKSIKFNTENNRELCTCVTLFLHTSLPSLHDYCVKIKCSLISRFMEDVNKRQRNFLSLSVLGYGS